MNFRHKKRAPIDISLTPMIDVVFLLLIFFMVTTSFTKESVIKVQLPQADGREVAVDERIIRFSIDKQGHYFLNNIALKSNTLETLIAVLTPYSEDKTIQFIISADASAPVQSAISVLDAAGRLEFKNITFATEKI